MPQALVDTLRLSRRRFMVLTPALGALSWHAAGRADALLKDTDPEAMAMAYVEDAARVPAAKFPQFKPGQTCANCSLYFGTQGAPSGGCSLFLSKDVAAIGWCSAWEKKA